MILSSAATSPHPAPSPEATEDGTARLQVPVQEIFSSIQGEAVYVGKRQVFVRFAHCHLKCRYCDTPMTTPSGQCQVETVPGSGAIELLPNPMTPEALLTQIGQLLPFSRHHGVSFTGGEPLLYHRFLRALFPQLQEQYGSQLRKPVYLETSGTQPEFLQAVLPWVDVIAMDIKLPSSTGEAAQFQQHALFYEVARSRPETQLFIKVIFNAQTTDEELDAIRAIVADRTLPLILQPETDLETRRIHVSPADVLRVEQALARDFEDVRVIPQTHKMLQVL